MTFKPISLITSVHGLGIVVQQSMDHRKENKQHIFQTQIFISQYKEIKLKASVFISSRNICLLHRCRRLKIATHASLPMCLDL